MALSDALEGRPTVATCRWQDFLNTLPGAEADAARRMMHGWEHPEFGWQKPWPVNRLLRAVRDEGYSIGDDAAYLHRNEECACRSSEL